jgi:hypothetical protein
MGFLTITDRSKNARKPGLDPEPIVAVDAGDGFRRVSSVYGRGRNTGTAARP